MQLGERRNGCRSADKSLAKPGRKQANVSVTMAWISFGALPCRGGWGEPDDSSRLDVVEIARVPHMLPSLFPSWLGKGLISTPVFRNADTRTSRLGGHRLTFRPWQWFAWLLLMGFPSLFVYVSISNLKVGHGHFHILCNSKTNLPFDYSRLIYRSLRKPQINKWRNDNLHGAKATLNTQFWLTYPRKFIEL